MADRYQNFILGKAGDAVGKATFEKLNPANKGESIGVFPRSDHRDIDRAVEGARSQWGRWATLPPPERGEILYRAVEFGRARRDALASIVTRESGKLLGDAVDETQAGLEALAFLAGEGQRLLGGAPSREGPGYYSLALPVPYGVAGVITSWCFPFALTMAAVGAALIAGNAVVLKPSEHTPLTAVRILEILLEAGVPPGVVALVHGGGEEAGAPLVRHPGVPLVALAGASEVVREAAVACAAEQKRAVLEVMRRDVVLVLEDADLEVALPGILQGTFAPLARRPAPAGAVVVQGKSAKELVARLAEAGERARPGDGLLAASDIPPLLTEQHLKRLQAWVRTGIREGAKLLCGGEVYREGDCRKGWFYAPTVLVDVQPAMRAAQDEIWGPVLTIVPAGTPEDAVARANALPASSTVTVYSRNVWRALHLAEGLQAERVYINGSPRHFLRVPFGKEMAGRFPSIQDVFTRWRTVAVDSGSRPAAS
ncbi:MAG TPA: aldehyde dehydrogenase family protein [Candidatus Sulfotelmatobacter sp.]|nr:aldehyde dehydrogenase family protein [Candidatus Sulfotelmatobacter sp.]